MKRKTDGVEEHPATLEIYEMASFVSRQIFQGCSEKIYKEALALEARARGFDVEREVSYAVSYNGFNVGHVLADLVVSRPDSAKVIIEVKAVLNLTDDSRNQVLNYARLAGHPFGVLLNFKTRGIRVEIETVYV